MRRRIWQLPSRTRAALMAWCSCSVLALTAAETGFTAASSSAKADLTAALERLGAQREEIEAAQIPLARTFNQLEWEVRERRRELERERRRRDSQTLKLAQLESDVSTTREALRFALNLQADYMRMLESRLNAAELAAWDAALIPAKQVLDDRDSPLAERMRALARVMEKGLERAAELPGGRRIEGKAILPDGLQQDGAFYISGPVSWFYGRGADVAGISRQGPSLEPRLHVLDAQEDSLQIRSLVEGGYGVVPVDPTLGDVLAIGATREGLIEHLAKGGVWIFPILAFGLLASLTAVCKSVQIFGLKQPHPRVLGALLESLGAGNTRAALKQAQAVRGPFGPMLADGVRNHREDRELLDEILYEHVLKLQPKLEKWLPVIAVTAATAPLLGLLGTVTGMIKTFNLITVFGTGDARALSGGISEALVTTEFGLIVAIPALVTHALLARRVQGILANMEKMSVAFLNGLPGRHDVCAETQHPASDNDQ